MRRTKLYSLVALTLSVIVPNRQIARAQSTGLADTLSVKPVMMLLVDTSGSMERMPDSSGCVDCLPSCTNSAADSTQKNRWAVTLEALTGSFNTFRCVEKLRSTYTGQYDQDYFLSHYDFTGSPAQASDGVMDSFRNQVKFGLMTFDGVSTTINGTTLVPQATYNSDATFKAQILGMEGQYSYPDVYASPSTNPALSTPLDAYGWKPLSFPGCTSVYGVNAGARGKGTLPGSLISVGPTDVGTDVTGTNDSIQTSLLQIRPYGGTPIAGMLDDLRYYLTNDTDVKQGSDPYYSCRQRFAILLTDGAPDTLFRNDARFQCESSNDAACSSGVCQCPYDTETNLATALTTRDGLKKLYLVAFNVNDTAALTTLDAIALAGNTTSAYRANNLSALRTQLTTILQGTASPATSRSVPTIVNTGTSLALGGSQFQVTAGFKVGQTATDPWEGRLYRQRNICNGTTPQYADLDSTKGDLFHITLNNQSTRTLNTVVPASVLANTIGSLFAYNGTAIALPATPNLIRPDHTSFLLAYTEVDSSGNAGQAVEEYNRGFSTFDKTINQAYFGDADGNGIGGQTADRDLISDYLRGLTTNRTGKRLGDIYHSNPTVALPIYKGADQTSVFDPTLRQFYTDLTDATGTGTGSTGIALGHYNNLQINQGRPGVVYVGTNDGILHAFNLDDWYDKSGTKYGAGYEFWGFVPPALFNKLAASSSPTHQFMFDGTPIVKDMVTVRTSTNVITMKTVLLAAVRGAPAFVALDVTFPEAPKFLWQRSFTYLGNTTGQPALAEVRVNWGGQVQTRAVAILPGGDGTLASASACDVDQLSRGTAASSTNSAGVANSARAKVRCWNKLGRSLYVVDVETGALIQEFDGRHFHSPMTGGIAVDGEGVAQTRAAYMTDQDGILWRLSMYNPDPSQWRVAPIWDLFAGNAKNFSDTAVAAASAAALYQAGRVSTYPPLLNRDPTTGTVNIILGTGDVDNLTDNAPNRVVSLKEQRVMDGLELGPGKITANWSLQLDAGEAVTGPITMVNDTAYFATFTGPAGGAGDLCTVGSSRLVGAHLRNAASASSPSLPKPMLTPEAGGLPLVLQYRPSTATGSLLLGLSVARDPVCIAGTVTNNNPLVAGSGRLSPSGATGGGTFQLRTMVAGGANSTAGTGMVGSDSANSQRQLTVTLPINNISRSVGWASSIE